MTILPSNPYLTIIKRLSDPTLDRDREKLFEDLIIIQLCILAFEGYSNAKEILHKMGLC